ncbi:MAG TPA: T9SS type A sorting domain-containing protein, partial [Agriterribacter sp.]|nr:T9SS type A sorting domain-containing protein [Agriterribacter sp.]
AGDVKIYPTLISNGRVNINSANRVDKIQLFNASGKLVFSSNMQGANGYFSIALPALQKGVYIIRLTGRDLEKNQKIIVQ